MKPQFFLITLVLVCFAFSSFGQNKTIRFAKAELIYNEHVGNDWMVWLEIENQQIFPGQSLSVKSTDLTVEAHAFEGKEKYNDHGITTFTLPHRSSTKVVEVLVTEHHGRYAGGQALWKFTLKMDGY